MTWEEAGRRKSRGGKRVEETPRGRDKGGRRGNSKI